MSNHGNVKSLITNKILKGNFNGCGYHYAFLRKNGRYENKSIHRLVAIAFIPNINNFPLIDHINSIKTDNYYLNLRWCTASQNIRWAYDNGLKENARKASAINGKNHCSKKVYCNELDMEFNSISDVERQLNIHNSGISQCCNGKRKSAGKHPKSGIPLTWKFI